MFDFLSHSIMKCSVDRGREGLNRDAIRESAREEEAHAVLWIIADFISEWKSN